MMRSRLGMLTVVFATACASSGPSGSDGDPVCEPDTRECAGDQLRTCAADGSEWITEDCDECVEAGGEAQCTVDACNPGQLGCGADGVTVLACDEDGAWEDIEACDPLEGQVCRQGSCQDACDVDTEASNSVGCAFYPVNLVASSGAYGIVVSNPNPWPAHVALSDADGEIESTMVAPGELYSFLLPGDRNVADSLGARGSNAFSLSSTLPVAAYQFSPLDAANQRSNDASLLLPANSLGTEYYAFTTEVKGVAIIPAGLAGSASTVTIVGTESDTEVTIFPSEEFLENGGIPDIPAGEPFTTTIGALEVLHVSSYLGGTDLTGSRIVSDKPVAVYGANACANIPLGSSYCDHIQEQMFPVETWGRDFVAVNYMPRGTTPEPDWWRILALHDDTVLTLSGADDLPEPPVLNAGQDVLIESTEAFTIASNKQVLVAHFMHGQSQVELPLGPIYTDPFETPEDCAMNDGHANLGDPALSLVAPNQQFRSEYAFLTPHTYAYDFVTVTTALANPPDLELDGMLFDPGWQTVGDGPGHFARFRVTDGAHTLRSTVPFGIEVHGYDCNVSYAYTGGLDLAPIVD